MASGNFPVKFSISNLFLIALYLVSISQRSLYKSLKFSREISSSNRFVTRYSSSLSLLWILNFTTRSFSGWSSFSNLWVKVLSACGISSDGKNFWGQRIMNFFPAWIIASINSPDGYPLSIMKTGLTTLSSLNASIISFAASRSLDLQGAKRASTTISLYKS